MYLCGCVLHTVLIQGFGFSPKRNTESVIKTSLNKNNCAAQEVKDAALKKGYLYQSSGCDAFYWQKVGRKVQKGNSYKFGPSPAPAVPDKCPETGSGFTMGGPYWTEPIHDPEWVQGILQFVKTRKPRFQAYDRLVGLLTTAGEELNDVPLYFNLHDLCKTLRCTSPRAEVLKSAIINAGYRVSGTHCTPLGVKTDAPW
jgi:tRNA (guanine26-N2/guanine27-N2)-dimethyltransferase